MLVEASENKHMMRSLTYGLVFGFVGFSVVFKIFLIILSYAGIRVGGLSLLYAPEILRFSDPFLPFSIFSVSRVGLWSVLSTVLFWVLIFLVLHRIYRMVRTRKFEIPFSFKGFSFILGAVGVLFLFVALVGLCGMLVAKLFPVANNQLGWLWIGVVISQATFSWAFAISEAHYLVCSRRSS